jgi:hypothetical protein
MAIIYHKETTMSEEETLLNEQEVATEAPTESTETTEATAEGWMMSEEIKGEGDAPEWFKASKYKSVADQAKAYAGLESKLGSFTGAPTDGYKIEMPEGVPEDALNSEDPLLVNFNEWAKEAGLSQEKHTELMGIYVNGMMEAQPSIEDEMQRMGKDAPQRINDFTSWAKANFNEGEFEVMQGLATTADGFGILEKMRSMSRETDVAAPSSAKPIDNISKEALYELVGDPRYAESPAFRKEVDKKFADFFGNQAQSNIRQ